MSKEVTETDSRPESISVKQSLDNTMSDVPKPPEVILIPEQLTSADDKVPKDTPGSPSIKGTF